MRPSKVLVLVTALWGCFLGSPAMPPCQMSLGGLCPLPCQVQTDSPISWHACRLVYKFASPQTRRNHATTTQKKNMGRIGLMSASARHTAGKTLDWQWHMRLGRFFQLALVNVACLGVCDNTVSQLYSIQYHEL